MTMNDESLNPTDLEDAVASDVIVEELVEEIEVIVDDAGEIEVIDAEIDVEVIDTDELLEQARPRPQSPFDRPGRWYVVHTQSGYEKKVKQTDLVFICLISFHFVFRLGHVLLSHTSLTDEES